MSLVGEGIHVSLGGREILSGVSLTCGKGRITGLIGPNGAGKSTLIRALAGLTPVRSGTVLLDGADLARMPARLRGRHLAYLPQERLVHWPLAVRHVVALGRLPHRGGRSADDAAAEDRVVRDALEAMDVAHLADRSVAELSGGELARVHFARTLAQQSPVILADEPTAGLDPAHALGLFEVLTQLSAKGHTIVIALHDLSLAARFCHDLVILAAGRVAWAGSPAGTLTEDRLERVFGARMAVGSIAGIPAVVPVAPTIGGREVGRR